LDALDPEKVKNMSTTCEAVESKPVPTAGADAGMLVGVVVSAALAMSAECIRFADVLPPTARTVNSHQSCQVMFVCEDASAIACEVATITLPKRMSKVMFPCELEAVDTRPAA
jgi:hypothetical protein